MCSERERDVTKAEFPKYMILDKQILPLEKGLRYPSRQCKVHNTFPYYKRKSHCHSHSPVWAFKVRLQVITSKTRNLDRDVKLNKGPDNQMESR